MTPGWPVRPGIFAGRSLGFGLNAEADLQAADRQPGASRARSPGSPMQGQSLAPDPARPGAPHALQRPGRHRGGPGPGAGPGETAAALAGFRPIHRRSQVQTLRSGVHLLNDCYNANPGSMAMALTTLDGTPGSGRAAAALGDMLELGSGPPPDHRELGRQAGRRVGPAGDLRQLPPGSGRRRPGSRHQPRTAFSRGDPGRGRPDFTGICWTPGDWLLVKGSRSMHMEGLIDLLESLNVGWAHARHDSPLIHGGHARPTRDM